MEHHVPGVGDLGAAAVRRIRIVVLHGPRPSGEHTTWLLSLVDMAGRVVARELIADIGILSLDHLVQPCLDVIGRRVDGDWLSDEDAAGQPRHRARLG